MRLPDADGFIVAAQKCLADGETRPYDVVFLHDTEGAMVAALLPIWAYERFVDWGRMPNHWHIEPEMGEEVPWIDP